MMSPPQLSPTLHSSHIMNSSYPSYIHGTERKRRYTEDYSTMYSSNCDSNCRISSSPSSPNMLSERSFDCTSFPVPFGQSFYIQNSDGNLILNSRILNPTNELIVIWIHTHLHELHRQSSIPEPFLHDLMNNPSFLPYMMDIYRGALLEFSDRISRLITPIDFGLLYLTITRKFVREALYNFAQTLFATNRNMM